MPDITVFQLIGIDITCVFTYTGPPRPFDSIAVTTTRFIERIPLHLAAPRGTGVYTRPRYPLHGRIVLVHSQTITFVACTVTLRLPDLG